MKLSTERFHEAETKANEPVLENINGRRKLRKDFTTEDFFAERLRLHYNTRIVKSFSLFPKKTLQGKVWLQWVWTFQVKQWHETFQNSWHTYETVFLTDSLVEMEKELKIWQENLNKLKLLNDSYKRDYGKAGLKLRNSRKEYSNLIYLKHVRPV